MLMAIANSAMPTTCADLLRPNLIASIAKDCEADTLAKYRGAILKDCVLECKDCRFTLVLQQERRRQV
jgi:hypothetical protein